MKEFFNVIDLDRVFDFISNFSPVGVEMVPIAEATGRILAEDIVSDVNLPDFSRSTMDGYAVCAAPTFGASDANPAYLTCKDTVIMGVSPDFTIESGEAAKIPTEGMLPTGSDSVVMIEHAEALDETNLEVYRSVAPGQHVIAVGEDFEKDQVILSSGQRLRPQEIGLLAAFGHDSR